MKKSGIEKLNIELKDLTAEESIIYFIDKYKGKITFATSLGAEDQVITEIISRINPSLNIFTLDTGRLFPQTYDLLDRTNKKYNRICVIKNSGKSRAGWTPTVFRKNC